MTFNDLDGNIVGPGDRIAYPGRRGSCLWMNTGVVVSIAEKSYWAGPYTEVKVKRKANDKWEKDGKIVTLTVTKNIVKL